jgi:DNA-binding transcriptional ArsR family regulator
VHELPKARTEGVISERIDDELVVYDEVSHMAHALAADARSVWERCDGCRSPAEIAQGLGMPPATVQQALDELQECGLLDDGSAPENSYSRRQAVTRIAKVGGAAVTAPLIYSVVIGSAAAAASACIANGQPESGCTAKTGAKAADSRCCSGTCYQTTGGSKLCVESDCVVAHGICVLGLIPCCAGPGTCTGIITLTCSS